MPNPSKHIPAPFKRPSVVLAYEGEYMEDAQTGDKVTPAGWEPWSGVIEEMTYALDGKFVVRWDRLTPLGLRTTFHLPKHRVKIDR